MRANADAQSSDISPTQVSFPFRYRKRMIPAYLIKKSAVNVKAGTRQLDRQQFMLPIAFSHIQLMERSAHFVLFLHFDVLAKVKLHHPQLFSSR